MIVIRVDYWPDGDKEQSYELGRAYVANDGTGTTDRGNYNVAICRKGKAAIPHPVVNGGPQATREGRVEDYQRERLPMWRLVMRALASAFPEERGGKAPKVVMPKPRAFTDALEEREPMRDTVESEHIRGWERRE